jgi:hypothetical protein
MLCSFRCQSNGGGSMMSAFDKDRFPEFFPQGHYFTPFPDSKEVKEDEHKIWPYPRQFPGIDLNEE